MAARVDDFECCPDGDFGFAVADIAADESVHWLVVFEIALDILNRGKLVGRFLIRKRFLHFRLPGRVRRQGVAGRGFPGGIQFDQLRRHLLDLLFGLFGRPRPVARVQPSDRRRRVCRADILLDPVYLVGRHINFIPAVVFQKQVVTLGPVGAFKPGNPRVAPDAVMDMHDIIAFAQLQVRRNLQALFEGSLRRLLMRPMPENIRIGCQHEVRFWQLKAAEKRAGEDKNPCFATGFQPLLGRNRQLMFGEYLPHPLGLLGDDDAAEPCAEPAVYRLEERRHPPGKRLHRAGLGWNRHPDFHAVETAPEKREKDRRVFCRNPGCDRIKPAGVRHIRGQVLAPCGPCLHDFSNLAFALLPPCPGLARLIEYDQGVFGNIVQSADGIGI